MSIDNFVVLDSVYGKFIVARTCLFQAEALVKTGRTHIESELNNIFALVDTLPDDAVIVDGGANIGFFTVPVAHRTQGRNNRIIAFEPQRQLFQALGGSLAINGYDHVYLHNCGLGAEPGKAQLPAVDYSIAQDFGTVSLNDKTTVDEHGWMTDRVVDVTSVDAMALPRLDFFKLDVEGYEVPALTGALDTIRKHRPWIWVEYFITGAEPIKQALADLDDYSFYLVDYQNMLVAPKERLAAITTTGLKEV
ncbi:MAG: FkbM family methyltransferase [Micrococcales bacterium]|nr:FkbM family methyltransferase [Micrococcales bacterium]